jgi:hypothetical protein
MSATLNALKHRLRNSTECRENPGISIASEAIVHAEELEGKLRKATNMLLDRNLDSAVVAEFIVECSKVLA